ncbi:ADIPOR-like receptor IZH2 [Spathaspora sp. JA1]|nr:ADIPOR-like receptor IZH2 [Spathaspora sp. JA1]
MTTHTIRQRAANTVVPQTKEDDDPSITTQVLRKLHFYHELDDWQKDNHFIRSGYVKETSSYRECFKSLTYLHNESVNIYSHLIPSSIVFWAVLYYINYQLTMYDNYLGVWEKLNFLQFASACTFCLFMSSAFHTIKAHSHKVSKFGNQLDYFGIVILISCSLISIILFAFYDHVYMKYFFVMLTTMFGTICTVLTLDPHFASVEYRKFRATMFVLFGLSGVLPILTGLYIWGFEETKNRSGVYWLILEGVFYIFGAILYAGRIPERFTHKEEEDYLKDPQPGRFDIFGGSKSGLERDEWHLVDFQIVGNDHVVFRDQILESLTLLQQDPEAYLIISGGETKKQAGPVSEALSYYLLAETLCKANQMESVLSRVHTEVFARDSFENVIYSVCRYYELFQEYPEKITIIGFEFKRTRFLTHHLQQALNYPLDRVTYIGHSPNPTGLSTPEVLRYFEELKQSEYKYAVKHFESDWYGITESLKRKKIARNPYNRYHGYIYSNPKLSKFLHAIQDDASLQDNETIRSLIDHTLWINN